MSTPKKKIFLENKRSYSIRSKDSNCISNNKKQSKSIISKGPWKSPENQLLIEWIKKNGGGKIICFSCSFEEVN